ncbi:MAG TPA: 6-bladed beta-propeller [Gemmatimonadaceae bacterium]|nr:6-bladed beta-propeller [Gemmatimonadaceae bacterium]
MRSVTTIRLLALAILIGACSAVSDRLPYTTTFTTVGDTVIAATTGDVSDSLARTLAIDWRASDSTTQAIGDVSQIAIGHDGEVWIWDGATPALWRLDSDGTSLKRISRKGSGPGEYVRANSIAVLRDGGLVMWDDGNMRVNFYNADGTHRSTASVAFSDCCGLTVMVDVQNRIWLMAHPLMIGSKDKPMTPEQFGNPQQIGYFRFDSTGKLLDTIMSPLLPGRDNNVSAIHASATGIGGMATNVPHGAYQREDPSPLGHIVTSLTRPYAVNAEANGKHVRITREFTPPPVSSDERSQLRANIEVRMKNVKADFTWNGPEIPNDKAPIEDISVALDGRIWVRIAAPSEPFEPDPPQSRGNAPAPPPVKFRAKDKRWDVFEPDGTYLGRVIVPRSISVYAMRGENAWGVVRDENDLAVVVRMHISPSLR